ncbi:MAG: hypothetical protein QOD07_2865 [Frankiaceae bacterium]|jgi:hypothetical protein|nr:hypothetical protein [Frankiaceae bacterium]
MRRTVGKALVAGTAAVMVGVLVPAASANSAGDTIRGGCYAYAVSNAVATNGQYEGVMGDNSVTTDATGAPTAATVTCAIQVNGIESPSSHSFSGAGVQAGQDQVVYSASPTDDVEVCQYVTYADGSTEAASCKDVGSPDAAYCPYGSVTGTGNWSPAETTTVGPHTFVWDTNANCLGAADDGGFYHVTFRGSSNDACTAGSGAGDLSGSGPEGPITGSFTFFRGGIHLYISGTFVSGGEQHNLQYWIDVLASAGGTCSYSTAPLLAHGAIVDSP